ncbi:hypothetical protein BXZ70DRAFT_1012946 [Cristinia sonorae]|uniref:CxC5 like cysteine cluster associated with KDZ domain-containing protein n=1 Tax=Cristinia sonorae TaxID=1940300 RepID=A0A8K0UFG8_9AGAR|nr:hypothetical protein BXZ70DRAFT_1012946 [Cristinia sonorae]
MDDLPVLLDRIMKTQENQKLTSVRPRLSQLVQFLAHAAQLKDYIVLTQHAKDPQAHNGQAPAVLPRTVADLLAEAVGLDRAHIKAWWASLKDIVWDDEYIQDILQISPAHLQLKPNSAFIKTYDDASHVAHSFFPPTSRCIQPDCRLKPLLKKSEITRVVFFTRANGPLPAHNIHTYCHVCNTNYHHNYYVSEHRFIERCQIESWDNMMLNGWTSATNCAENFNRDHAKSASTFAKLGDTIWPCTFVVEHAHVWDAFVYRALLEDAFEQGVSLELPHGGEQRDRFKAAMNARSTRLQVYGLPTVLHKCNKCVRYFDQRESGGGIQKVSCVVMDGVTIGHPCCGVPNCKKPLEKQNDHFCTDHTSESDICSVTTCRLPIVPGTRTCSTPEHQAVEAEYKEVGKGRRSLKERLKRAREALAFEQTLPPTVVNDMQSHEGEEHNNVEDIDDFDCVLHPPSLPGGDITASHVNGTTPSPVTSRVSGPATTAASPGSGNPPKKIRARFGRKRTHNEQFLVAPCGVVMGRATFYNSEAVSSAAEFVKRVYENTGVPPPDHVIFDNNCHVVPHVRGDPFFENIGLTVDVFHFKSKHRISDHACQETCNPAAYPELMNDDGTWFFNSSACEQFNSWVVGYVSMCREMTAEKFNFFLDEMCMRRNRDTIAELEEKGYAPRFWHDGEVPL